jgi:hypothetical protein
MKSHVARGQECRVHVALVVRHTVAAQVALDVLVNLVAGRGRDALAQLLAAAEMAARRSGS